MYYFSQQSPGQIDLKSQRKRQEGLHFPKFSKNICFDRLWQYSSNSHRVVFRIFCLQELCITQNIFPLQVQTTNQNHVLWFWTLLYQNLNKYIYVLQEYFRLDNPNIVSECFPFYFLKMFSQNQGMFSIHLFLLSLQQQNQIIPLISTE